MTDHAGTGGIAGDWHLLDIAASEQEILFHRIDLRFMDDHNGCRGAVLNRNNGAEIPLAAVVLDGAELRLQMTAAPERPQTAMPWLVMRRHGARFEGHWQQDGKPSGPTLKLFRQNSAAVYAPPMSHPSASR